MSAFRLAASILNADFASLAEQIAQAESAGVDWIHVDVMDGHFVPNITMGFVVLEAIARSTRLPIDVHLMIERPDRYLTEFAEAGAHSITVHAEASRHLHRVVDSIKNLGVRAGVALNPATPLACVEEVCSDIDLLLVMTINPGFGGQALIPAMVNKVRRARELLSDRGARAYLQVDGGVKSTNLATLAQAGADTFVVGTGIFRAPGGIADGVAEVRRALERAR